MRISKRILCTFLVVLIALMSAPLQGFVEIGQTDLFSTKASAASDYSDYIPIFDANDLKAISENLDAKYILIKDIDLASENWTPIGTESAPFTGIFDGNGNTISNLNISGTYANGAQIGLFGYANGAELTNVKLKNVQINILGTTASNAYLSIGPICGVIKNTIIDKCDADGNIVCSAEKGNYVRVAGIVGESYSSSSITNCLSSCSLVGNAKSQNCMVGGITAWLGASSIAKCLFAGSINAGTSSTYVYCGGIGASGDCGISESVVLASELNNNGISSAYGTSLNGYICWRNTSNNRVLTGISGNVTGLRGSGNSMITEEQAVNQNTYTDMDWDFNDIWFMDNGYPSLRHNATCENVDAWESAGEQFPEGYDFKEDSFSFGNYRTSISEKYFTTMFGAEKGKLLYRERDNGEAGGQCFGMAYVTAAIYYDMPKVDNIYQNRLADDNINDIRCENLRQALKRSFFLIDNKKISIEDYIKYAYIYQNSTDNLICQYNALQNNTDNDAKNVFSYVETCISNNNVTVIVLINNEIENGERKPIGAHAVLAVGINGNKIIVDDSNNTENYEYITVNSDGTWVFSNPWTTEGIGSHNNSTIYYLSNITMPYQLLKTGKTTTTDIVLIDKILGTTVDETYVEGMDKLDTDKLLMFVDSESHQIDSKNLIEITDAIGTDESEADDTGNLYWVSEDKTVTISDITGENNEIIVAGNDVSVGVKTQDNSVVTMTVDEENDDISAKIDSVTGNEYSITFEATDENENDLITTLSGTANGDEVTATETEDGIQVTGLNNITVTYETADGTAETTAKVDDGSTVNITVNDDENTVETDWQCKHPDDNHDGICDSCAEDFTKGCSCNCHSNAFMQFLHKILCFLYRIFGMEQYRYCGCGKAHW